jgi:hypothetical protein
MVVTDRERTKKREKKRKEKAVGRPSTGRRNRQTKPKGGLMPLFAEFLFLEIRNQIDLFKDLFDETYSTQGRIPSMSAMLMDSPTFNHSHQLIVPKRGTHVITAEQQTLGYLDLIKD